MKLKEGVFMNKYDWRHALSFAFFLLLMIAGNILIVFWLLSSYFVLIGIYIAFVILVMIGATYLSINYFGYTVNRNPHWIKNHFLFWVMLDYHALLVITRYMFPKDRTYGFLPEIVFLIQLLLMIPVFLSERWVWYRKNEFYIQSLINVIAFGLVSYQFIAFIVQTMQ